MSYRNIMRTILLDREEVWLREEGANTLNDVIAYYMRHYPDASEQCVHSVTHELWRRLQIPKPEPDILKCRLPLL